VLCVVCCQTACVVIPRTLGIDMRFVAAGATKYIWGRGDVVMGALSRMRIVTTQGQRGMQSREVGRARGRESGKRRGVAAESFDKVHGLWVRSLKPRTPRINPWKSRNHSGRG
jgi:hypothetical protein